MNFIKTLWRGDISLSVTYWGMGVLMNVIFSVVFKLLNMLGYYDEITDIKIIIIITLSAAVFLYSIFISVCIWRSANHYIADADASSDEEEDGTWGYWAKVIVGLSWFFLLIQLPYSYMLQNISNKIQALNTDDIFVTELINCAQKDNPACQLELAIIYFEGEKVEENQQKAFEWLKLSAENGYSLAQNEMGVLYKDGCDEGCLVPQNYKKAFNWYQLAANQGEILAQYNMGELYYKGNGVRKDIRTAYKWYGLSAENGYYFAQYNIGRMLILGHGIEKNEIEGLSWLLISEALERRKNEAAITREKEDIDVFVAKSTLSKEETRQAKKMAETWLKEHPEAAQLEINHTQ